MKFLSLLFLCLSAFASEKIPVTVSIKIEHGPIEPFPEDPNQLRSYCARLIQKLQPHTLRSFFVAMGEKPDAQIAREKNVTRLSEKKNVTTLATTEITPDNIEEIFSHEFEPGKFGAKGLALLTDEKVHNTAFWQTGIGASGIEVHHRDVMASLFRAEQSLLEEYSEVHLQVAEWFSMQTAALGENPKAQKDIYLGMSEGLLELAQDRSETAKRLANQANALSNVRSQESFPSERLPRGQGFQMTAQRTKEGFKIVHLDVDSSLTSAQLFHGAELDAEFLSDFVSNIHVSIDPSLRAYKVVRIRGWNNLKLRGGLALPDGLRAVSFP